MAQTRNMHLQFVTREGGFAPLGNSFRVINFYAIHKRIVTGEGGGEVNLPAIHMYVHECVQKRV